MAGRSRPGSGADVDGDAQVVGHDGTVLAVRCRPVFSSSRRTAVSRWAAVTADAVGRREHRRGERGRADRGAGQFLARDPGGVRVRRRAAAGQDPPPQLLALGVVGQVEADAEPDPAGEGLVERGGPVARQDDDPGVQLDPLEQVVDLEVGVAVAGVGHLAALAEQAVRLVEEQDDAGGRRLVEHGVEVALGLAEPLADDLGEVDDPQVAVDVGGDRLGGGGLAGPAAGRGRGRRRPGRGRPSKPRVSWAAADHRAWATTSSSPSRVAADSTRSSEPRRRPAPGGRGRRGRAAGWPRSAAATSSPVSRSPRACAPAAARATTSRDRPARPSGIRLAYAARSASPTRAPAVRRADRHAAAACGEGRAPGRRRCASREVPTRRRARERGRTRPAAASPPPRTTAGSSRPRRRSRSAQSGGRGAGGDGQARAARRRHHAGWPGRRRRRTARRPDRHRRPGRRAGRPPGQPRRGPRRRGGARARPDSRSAAATVRVSG